MHASYLIIQVKLKIRQLNVNTRQSSSQDVLVEHDREKVDRCNATKPWIFLYTVYNLCPSLIQLLRVLPVSLLCFSGSLAFSPYRVSSYTLLGSLTAAVHPAKLGLVIHWMTSSSWPLVPGNGRWNLAWPTAYLLPEMMWKKTWRCW